MILDFSVGAERQVGGRGLLFGSGHRRRADGLGLGDEVESEVAAGFDPVVVLLASTAPTRRISAARSGKMPTTSVRRRISGLSRSWERGSVLVGRSFKTPGGCTRVWRGWLGELGMDIGAQDGLFDESGVPRVEIVDDGRVDTNGGLKKRFKAFEPDAVMLVPPSLDEWLPANHLSRFIAELVDTELDLDRFYTSYAKAKGQPPYDPRLMLRIVLYGYCVGVRSSRELERACTDVVAFRWLARQ